MDKESRDKEFLDAYLKISKTYLQFCLTIWVEIISYFATSFEFNNVWCQFFFHKNFCFSYLVEIGLSLRYLWLEMSKSFEFMNCIFISQNLKHKLFSQQVVATFCKLPDFFCNEWLVKVLLCSKAMHQGAASQGI